MSFASLQWQHRISELSDIFSDITSVNIVDDDAHFEIPITSGTDDGTTGNHDQQQTIYAVTSIDYTEAYRIAYGYIRAILRTNEMSWRTLKLSATCLQLHPANYTVWHYRRQCLTTLYHKSQESLKDTIDDEDNENDSLKSKHSMLIDWSYVWDDLSISSFLGGDNPKNYQIWYHRRALLEQVPTQVFIDITNKIELQYINSVLDVDAKNYHAWSHRQWILSVLVPSILTSLQHYDESHRLTVNDMLTSLWENELIYTEDRINDDIRNNSAWNYRWYVIHHRNSYRTNAINSTGTRTNSNDLTTLVQTPPFNIYDTALSSFFANIEIEYAIQIATIDPYNESPWKYLIAILREQQQQQNEDQDRYDNDDDSIITILKNVEQQIEMIERDCLLPNTSRSPNRANGDISGSYEETLDVDGRNENNDSVDNAATATTDCEVQHHHQRREQHYNHRIPSLYLLNALIDVWVMMGDTKSFENAIQCIESYMIQYDPIRTNYWQYRLQQIIHSREQLHKQQQTIND
jgi:protein farnesyltransferase/geranylgeranyltransferase type-1 subunit alpha